MDLPLLTSLDETKKPWLNIYANSLTAKTVTATQNYIFGGDLEVKGDELVDGYSNTLSDQVDGAVQFLLSTITDPGLPALTFSPFVQTYYDLVNGQVIASGEVTGTNNQSAVTTDLGFTFSQLTNIILNPSIEWSPKLALYTAVNVTGNTCSWSTTGADLSWSTGTGTASNFSGAPIWFPDMSEFLVPINNLAFGTASSTDGKVYALQTNDRPPIRLAAAPASSGLGTGMGRVVGVGTLGVSYSDDGVTWTHGNSLATMESVTWSSLFKAFYAIPRTVSKNLIYVSPDGINWSARLAGWGSATQLRDILFIDQLQVFVAVGDNQEVWTSKNATAGSFKQNYNISVGTPLAFYHVSYYPETGQIYIGTNASDILISHPQFVA